MVHFMVHFAPVPNCTNLHVKSWVQRPPTHSIMLKYTHARCQTDVMGEAHGNDTAGF